MKTSIKFVGYVPSDTWAHYAWNVDINGTVFEYKTGTGHATPRRKTQRNGYMLGWNKKPENSTFCESTESWAHIPNVDAVLDALFSDSDAGAVSFNDFCADFGYDNDSLRALDTYRACMASAEKLRKALGKEYATERARIDALRNEGKL